MPLRRLLWTLVAIAVLTAYSIAADGGSTPAGPPPARTLAAFAGCSDATPRAVAGSLDSVICQEHGFDVTVMTFDDNRRRDAWVDGERTWTS